MDADWNSLGSSWVEGDRSGSYSQSDVTVDGSVTGYTVVSSYADGGGTRSENMMYDLDWILVSGTVTEDGVTTVYGAGWEELSRTADVTAFADEDAISSSDLDGLPSQFSTAKYATTQGWDWDEDGVDDNSQTTYFDADGSILGYSDTWVDGDRSGTNHMDADWNWLSGSYVDGTYASPNSTE